MERAQESSRSKLAKGLEADLAKIAHCKRFGVRARRERVAAKAWGKSLRLMQRELGRARGHELAERARIKEKTRNELAAKASRFYAITLCTGIMSISIYSDVQMIQKGAQWDFYICLQMLFGCVIYASASCVWPYIYTYD